MASEHEFYPSRATPMQYFTDEDGGEEEGGEIEEESTDDEVCKEEEKENSSDWRSLYLMCGGRRGGGRRRKSWSLGQVFFDPRAKWVQEWNRVFLLVCATGLFVDPLFFYALSISDTCMCLFVDGWFAITVTALRCMTDALHVWNMCLQLKMIKRSSSSYSRGNDKRSGSESEGEGGDGGEGSSNRPRAANGRHLAFQCLKAKKGLFFDLLVILPLPQIVLWVAIPSLLEKGSVTLVMTVFLIIFLFQYLPKIYHSVCLLRRMQNLSGYIFGTVWWGIALNLIAYFVASHVFLHATTSKKQAMQLKMRNIEWWMRKRRLPSGFKQRVRNYERQRWAAMRGVDECQMIRNLPEGLRRDIKYHLCLDLVRQVPLFQHMDDLVLENICDRVKSLIFTKGETITREGDPVQRMLFVVRGHLQSSQVLRDGVKSCCMLGPGNFSGDELLSWCLRRPFIERLPPSTSTLVTLETTEAFGLDAEDVKYVTQHFRYTFVNERVKRSARYYSPGWRTWAAVAIQLAWRRYKHRLTLTSLSFIRPRRPLSRSNSLGEDRLRLYTAMLTSPKPNQDDFDF
ncbi:cyclic nucleotide-gated ion channel 4 isoform X2 [Gossypium hirsutum]|uniref:Cyclic nucleotide-gated ion channel 4 isoform X2 n=1 Tax=Gossypium hirsutum TaxID=3635 RepID=A0ABM2YQR1_GOSHI|nr:cyclic nucleotide-gated ion channel 4 isoform X2 [Gossypium hirsutum]